MINLKLALAGATAAVALTGATAYAASPGEVKVDDNGRTVSVSPGEVKVDDNGRTVTVNRGEVKVDDNGRTVSASPGGVKVDVTDKNTDVTVTVSRSFGTFFRVISDGVHVLVGRATSGRFTL